VENVVSEETKKNQPGKRTRKVETVRSRAEKSANTPKKSRRLRRTASSAVRPAKILHRIGKREYYLPMPDNRPGRFLNKRRSLIPRYFRDAWAELRLVVWPGRRETWKLTVAVFIFAIALALLVAVTDYGLDKLFRRILT